MPFAAYNFHVQDQAGNDVSGASIAVIRESDGVIVALYADRDGTVALGNPFTSLTATGRFYVDGGCYRITSLLPGTSVVWRHVAIGTAAEHDAEDFATASSVRELLQANRTYFVRKDGNNSNNGQTDSALGAFLTIARAMTEMTKIDTNGFNAFVQVRADGAPPTIYKESVGLVNVVGYRNAGNLRLLGDPANPANIVIDASQLVSSINTATNEITFTTAHGFVLDQEINFRVMPGGTVPGVTGAPGSVLPQSPDSVWVKSIPNANTITIALTLGGATADITSAGSGVIRASGLGNVCVNADGLRSVWWVQGFTMHALDKAGFGIRNLNSRIQFGQCDFDQCGFAHVLYSDNGSGDVIGGGYNIRGKTTQGFHYLIQQQSQIVTINSLLTSNLGKAEFRSGFTVVGLGVSMHRGENMRFGSLVTANAATNEIAWTAHGLAENDPVQMYPDVLATGVAPAPLAYGTAYYAHIINTNTIQLMATPSGAIIDLTTAGSGGGQRAVSFSGNRAVLGDATCIIYPPSGNFPGTP